MVRSSTGFGQRKAPEHVLYTLMRAIILAFLIALPSFGRGEDHLYALIACDTQSNLRYEVMCNKTRLLDALETISTQAGLTLHSTVLTGIDLTEEKIFEWLDEVRQSPNGVVLFSYSGHGYRNEQSVGEIPLLFFCKKSRTFQTPEFYRQLESSGQRLIIMLLDCCNSFNTGFMFEKRPPERVIIRRLPGMKKLFLGTKGTAVFMGASPGGTSWYYRGRGGLFTSSFIQSLMEETKEESASWKSLFRRTYDRCAPQQHPFSLLDVSSCEGEEAS